MPIRAFMASPSTLTDPAGPTCARRAWVRHGLGACALLLLVTGCEGGSKLRNVPDEKLIAEVARCDRIANPSSLKQVMCDNHRRECNRRQLCTE